MNSHNRPPAPLEGPPDSKHATAATRTAEPPRGNGAPTNSTRLALGALVVVCLIWGYNWVVMKIGLRYAAPFDFVALRNVGGAACLFLLLVVRGSHSAPRPCAIR